MTVKKIAGLVSALALWSIASALPTGLKAIPREAVEAAGFDTEGHSGDYFVYAVSKRGESAVESTETASGEYFYYAVPPKKRDADAVAAEATTEAQSAGYLIYAVPPKRDESAVTPEDTEYGKDGAYFSYAVEK